MNETSPTIPKEPTLNPAEDFYHLRREGIRYIEEMGSRLWTDYNEHDPGITILEALCYAITDLAYRTGWDVKDLLAPKVAAADTAHPYPGQPFFTAREILTVNPVTPEDLRRLLIDLDLVRNAWLVCKECACEASFFAWCDGEKLLISYDAPKTLEVEPVWPRGLYDALLELESDPHLGDLNDRKIESRWSLPAEGGARSAVVELRFPAPSAIGREGWSLFLERDDLFAENGKNLELSLTAFGFARSTDAFAGLTDAERTAYLRRHWRDLLYVSFRIKAGTKEIEIENAAVRFLGDKEFRDVAEAPALLALLLDRSVNGFIQRYRQKEKLRSEAVGSARRALLERRNLDEDFCRVRVVGIEEVAVCADVEVRPDADIELVQARIWFEVEQYFNPPVPFYSLQELIDSGVAVEEIFNGPTLTNGFIRGTDLEGASLRGVLRVSDIMNRLMDIDGVVSVNRLQLTKYDGEGRVVLGAADVGSDGDKSSASWSLQMTPQHQPRLYLNASRFLFFKNGLPFLPRMDEALDTLTQLRGEGERLKIRNALQDLPVPVGTPRDTEGYLPVQYTFPLCYGIGADGLPAEASSKRKAQAKQLKGYLLVFEQILANAFAQLAHLPELFSLDREVAQTYFVKALSEELLRGYAELNHGLDQARLQELAETREEFEARRNRFLDHILARFGEGFGEYALLLSTVEGARVALDRLIEDKISFISAYPAISSDRGKGFNYREYPVREGGEQNFPGIKRRVSLLLGYPDLAFSCTVSGTPGSYRAAFALRDQGGRAWLQGEIPLAAGDGGKVPFQGYRRLLVLMVQPESYDIVSAGDRFRLVLRDGVVPVGEQATPFSSREDAQALADELLAWSANERMIVVEHLLLRPKFPGDALYPACFEGACETFPDEDPFYSFRLTYVMPGWAGVYNENVEMRRYAERTIRKETPAHLFPKICWVGNDGFSDDPCSRPVWEMAELFLEEGRTAEGARPEEADACACAKEIFDAFSDTFREWFEEKTLEYLPSDILDAELKKLFAAAPGVEEFTCTTVLAPLWEKVVALLVAHFSGIARYGWQFERFEDAWYKWLEANAAIDWSAENLQEEVEGILLAGLDSAAPALHLEKVRTCACSTLARYGKLFHVEMEKSFKKGTFEVPHIAVALHSTGGLTFNAGTEKKVETLLKERYGEYPEVSYRLWVVLNLLAGLRNTYPAATLHDCDEGNDKNPVRLGITALGS